MQYQGKSIPGYRKLCIDTMQPNTIVEQNMQLTANRKDKQLCSNAVCLLFQQFCI